MKLRFLGCGDAFGSGGRFNTCFLVEARGFRFLIDCGASSMVAMRRFGVEPNDIDAILITHLHGDHFGGLPFLLVDANLGSRRTRPLMIAGPPTLQARLGDAMECFFPGSTRVQPRYDLRVEELSENEVWRHGPLAVTPYPVRHACGAPPYALRVECDGRIIAYSGDTEWVETLIPVGRDADLFIAEAYFYDKPIKFHLSFAELMAHREEIDAKRMVLTHMSHDMLDRVDGLGVEAAEDGMEIVL